MCAVLVFTCSSVYTTYETVPEPYQHGSSIRTVLARFCPGSVLFTPALITMPYRANTVSLFGVNRL